VIRTFTVSERGARSTSELFSTLRPTLAICQATELSNIWKYSWTLSEASKMTTATSSPALLIPSL
jgi:hypothetical protein